jgi:hypothetical protein
VLKCLCWLLLLLLAALTDCSICADVQQILHSTYSMFRESLGPLLERQRGSYPSVSEDAERNSHHPSVSEEAEINSRPSWHSPPLLEVLGPQPLHVMECYVVEIARNICQHIALPKIIGASESLLLLTSFIKRIPASARSGHPLVHRSLLLPHRPSRPRTRFAHTLRFSFTQRALPTHCLSLSLTHFPFR